LFGERLEDYDALFAEKIDLLLRIRASDHVTWSGSFRPPLHQAPVSPRAYQQPLPVWAGVGGSPASAERAGLLGLPMVLGYIGGPLSHASQAVEFFGQFDWGGLPRALVEELLHRYATEIVPAVRSATGTLATPG
jgi:alkanesulfonate monooxygenase SsuD/methylene tetrahydromethanopterin reductase-like flavin-dependent oxidoreductase (luciferase family)